MRICSNDTEHAIRFKIFGRNSSNVPSFLSGSLLRLSLRRGEVLIHSVTTKIVGLVHPEQVAQFLDHAESQVEADSSVWRSISKELVYFRPRVDSTFRIVLLYQRATNQPAHRMRNKIDFRRSHTLLRQNEIDK